LLGLRNDSSDEPCRNTVPSILRIDGEASKETVAAVHLEAAASDGGSVGARNEESNRILAHSRIGEVAATEEFEHRLQQRGLER
jgi:hypothetical protein